MFFALRKLGRRFGYWIDRDRHERELREEMEEHRRRRGVASLPSPAIRIEDASAVWIPPRLATFLQDLRYGSRQLGHNRLFTFVAISGLVIAIGLNTAVFSIAEAVFWRPLPVNGGDRVVRMLRMERDDRTAAAFSEAELLHYQGAGVLEGVTGMAIDDRVMADWPQTNAPRAISAFVAPNFFEMLGGETVAGRLLHPDDDTAVLVSDMAWRRRLGGRADAIGTKLRLNGFPFTIAGVVTSKSISILESGVDVVLPLRALSVLRLTGTRENLRLLGKLPAGVDFGQGEAALGVAAQRWFAAHPEDTKIYRPLAIPARLAGYGRSSGFTGSEMLLPVAVLLVLLIACANLTNLLLARAEARRREMAVRISLGASRLRLVRQLLTECFLLTAIAGMLGLLAANGGLRIAQAMLPRILPIEAIVPWLDLTVSGTVFAYTLSLCAVTAFLFGLAPAIEATRGGVAGAMKADPFSGAKAGGSRVRDFLIAAQIAACTVLLVVTASLNSAMSVLDDFVAALDYGAVVQSHIFTRSYGYSPSEGNAFLDRLGERAALLPGVEAAGFTNWPLLRNIGGGRGSEVEVEGRAARSPAPSMTGTMSNGCLRVFGMRLVSGRDFTASESRAGSPVVIVNEPMARDLWPGSSPLGARIRVWSKGKPEPWQEVVGVTAEKAIAGVGAGSYSLLRPIGASTGRYLQVRTTAGDRAPTMAAVGALIREMDPRIASNVNSAATLVEFARLGPRLTQMVALAVALAALWMSAIGLYGVTAYVATRRTKEIGIRMALGARTWDVLRLMSGRGSVLVAAGLVLGLGGARLAERVLAAGLSLLPVSPFHVYVAIAGFLAAVALLAMLLPSLRASRVNPLAALRYDG